MSEQQNPKQRISPIRMIGRGVKYLAGTVALAGATYIGYLGLSDSVPENHVLSMKSREGIVTFIEGPHRGIECLMITGCTSNLSWDGNRYIDLPLSTSSEDARNYKTRDGYIDLDILAGYQIGKSEAQRKRWFVDLTDPEQQLPRDVDGIVRSIIAQYTNDQILNEEEARKAGLLPFPERIHLSLYESGIPQNYGLDPESFEVIGVNFSPLPKVVRADLRRQRNLLMRDARSEAQEYIEAALAKKAEVDGEYSQFIRNLSDSELRYLETLLMTEAVSTAGTKSEEQQVDLLLAR